MKTDQYGLRTERRPELTPPVVSAIPACEDDSLVIYDADGTLWVNDVADDFTLWMMDQQEISRDNWRTYQRIYADDHPTGCRYLLTFYKGMSQGQLHAKIDEYWRTRANRAWIWEVVESLLDLAAKAYPVWVVSGTPTDFLLPLKQMLPVEQVVGMDFELDADARITGNHAGISCAGAGKAEKLIQLIGERNIRFACGNGSLDGPMMKLADSAWSVYPNPEFAQYSRAQGWPILSRPADFVEEEKFTL